jgi:exodeoxyribonuclease VIII
MTEPKICMLDIETLDVLPTAHILSIGAVDVYGAAQFYVELEKYQYSRTTSQDTLDWWDKQVIKRPVGIVPLKDALEQFKSWYEAQAFTEVWCKGSDFDFVILADAFRQEGLALPWKYHQVRDLRTLIKVFPTVEAPIKHTIHHALMDAICQAEHLRALNSYINTMENKMEELSE